MTVWDDLVGQAPRGRARCSAAVGGPRDDATRGCSPGRRAPAAPTRRWPSRPRCSASGRLRRVPRVPHRRWPAPTPTSPVTAPRSSRSASTRCASSSAASALAPVGDRWQVMIVEDADRLTEPACNALLKAIEEPTARTVWMLCAPDRRGRAADDPVALPAASCCPRRRRGGRRLPGPPTASAERWRRTPPAPARATSAGPARWPATRPPATAAARCRRSRPG